MYARFKCDNCSEWHGLDEIPTSHLFKAYLCFTVDPPPPFDGRTWGLIITAEQKRRTGSTPGAAPSGKS